VLFIIILAHFCSLRAVCAEYSAKLRPAVTDMCSRTDRQTDRHAHCNSLSFHGHRQFCSQQYDFSAQRATNLHGGELKLLQVDTILPQRVRITTNDNLRRTSTPHDSRSRLWFAHRMSTVVQQAQLPGCLQRIPLR